MPTMARRAEPLKEPKAMPRLARVEAFRRGLTKHRIVSAAELWLARYPGHANGEIRFDVIVVTPGKLPHHIVNAFNAAG
jgi:hypothetical protein